MNIEINYSRRLTPCFRMHIGLLAPSEVSKSFCWQFIIVVNCFYQGLKATKHHVFQTLLCNWAIRNFALGCDGVKLIKKLLCLFKLLLEKQLHYSSVIPLS